jgi:hypothetical protein
VSGPASLATMALKPVTADDEGIYKCRVDFKEAPTKTSNVHLRVISKFSIAIYLSLLLIVFGQCEDLQRLSKMIGSPELFPSSSRE